MFFFTFFFFSFSLLVADPKNTVDKIKKINEMIDTLRVVDFLQANNTYFALEAIPSHNLPSSEERNSERTWTYFNSSTLDFNNSKNIWYLFQGDLQAPFTYHKEDHRLRFDFRIKRKYDVRPWDDEFPAGPEGRIWLNGKPFGAIDEFHDSATIRELGHVELRVFGGRCNSSHVLEKFGVSVLHKNTESLYQRIRFLLSILDKISSDSFEHHQIVRILDETVRLLDIRDLSFPIPLKKARKHDKANSYFYSSTYNALEHLKKLMSQLPKFTKDDPAISIIGYSHIDTCWLWKFELSHYKSANTAVSMLRLIDNPPEDFEGSEVKWKFLATSAMHYKWLKEDSPEIYQRVIKAIKNGRWEANGVSWVESDTTLPSGESLVRQLVSGIRYFEKEVGSKQTVLFLPDCFGFSGSLPQIMKKSGIDSFVTSKISWSEYTKFPYSTFKWRGIDGTDVFAHFITTPTQWEPEKSTYTGKTTAFEMIGTLKDYQQKFILPTSALHISGNGDGGGGITEEMVWNMNLMNELPRISGVPRVEFPSLTELFEKIKEKENELPVWDDELYLEYHRGISTSQEEIKRLNKRLEAYLHNCEYLSTVIFSCVSKKAYSNLNIQSQLDSIWEETLLLHFHDAIPGTSVNEANHDILRRGEKCLKKLARIERTLSTKLASYIAGPKINSTIIFNTLSHERKIAGISIPSGGWTIKNKRVKILYDDFVTTTTEELITEDVEVNHSHHYVSSSQPCKPTPKIKINASAKTVKTPFLSIEFNEYGMIKSVKDNKTGREYISSFGTLFELYEDRPLNWPAWDIQLYHKEMQLLPPVFDGYEFTPFDNSVTLHFSIPKMSSDNDTTKTVINQTIYFSEDSPHIDFQTSVEWTQHNKLLKIAFPTTIRSKSARYGTQFGNIQRPTHNNHLHDIAKFEVNGRWADLSDANGGITVCSDVKTGYDIHENVIRLSLLKAPMQTDKWSDFGRRKFNYRVAFHSCPFEEAGAALLSDEVNIPIVVARQKLQEIRHLLPSSAEFVSLSTNKVILETLKIAYNENGFIARVYESVGGWTKCQIKFPLLNPKKWNIKIVNLKEEEEMPADTNNLKISNEPFLSFEVELKPFEILSILIEKNCNNIPSDMEL